MQINEKIGFIGGGRMAEALIKGLLSAGLIERKFLVAADPDPSRRALLEEQYTIACTDNSGQVAADCRIVILAVKPQVMGQVLDGLAAHLRRDSLLISIAAGIPISLIERHLGGAKAGIVRVMPNTPALVLAGASALSAGKGVSADDLLLARSIFDAVGTSVVVEEGYLDAVTGLSGSGPAYVFSFIEALIDAGVKTGLARPVASELALQTVYGSVLLAMEEGKHPAELRAMVTSPGGTTIAGLHVLERAGFTGIIMDAVEAATKRSRELAGD